MGWAGLVWGCYTPEQWKYLLWKGKANDGQYMDKGRVA